MLTSLPWIREQSGPRAKALEPVLLELDRAGQLPPWLLPKNHTPRRIAESRADYVSAEKPGFSARAVRSLQRVLWQFGSSTDRSIYKAVESTRSFQQTAVSDPIDLSQERAWLIEDVNQREPDLRQWGDPAASAAEDEEIMAALAGWRAEANRELLDE